MKNHLAVLALLLCTNSALASCPDPCEKAESLALRTAYFLRDSSARHEPVLERARHISELQKNARALGIVGKTIQECRLDLWEQYAAASSDAAKHAIGRRDRALVILFGVLSGDIF